jgi:hypothetical protein
MWQLAHRRKDRPLGSSEVRRLYGVGVFMAKKTMEDIVAQIESDIHMTVKRRAHAYSSEHAYYLVDCAKLF